MEKSALSKCSNFPVLALTLLAGFVAAGGLGLAFTMHHGLPLLIGAGVAAALILVAALVARGQRTRASLLGAILIHPALLLGFFVFGALFGARDAWNMDRPPAFGVKGGMRATDNLLTGYFITAGAGALLATAVGAGLGFGVRYLVRTRDDAPTGDSP
jgi:hypothetical protein